MPHLFFSGTQNELTDTDPRIRRDVTWYRLLSLAYPRIADTCSETTIIQSSGNCELMYDSGAFTAWNKGVEVDLDTLCTGYDTLIKQYGARCKKIWLINLDKIPGRKGVSATAQELVEAMEISQRNYALLVSRFGDCVLPVFHQDEPFSELRSMTAPFICVSPRNDLPEGQRRKWAVEAHTHIPEGQWTHGLAATGKHMMTQVPWRSVDSATWIFVGSAGGIFTDNLSVLSISKENTGAKTMDAHFDSLSPLDKRAMEESIKSKGFTVDELREAYQSRIVYNRIVQMQFTETAGAHKKRALQETLF
jgi:hypothetical protein